MFHTGKYLFDLYNTRINPYIIWNQKKVERDITFFFYKVRLAHFVFISMKKMYRNWREFRVFFHIFPPRISIVRVICPNRVHERRIDPAKIRSSFRNKITNFPDGKSMSAYCAIYPRETRDGETHSLSVEIKTNISKREGEFLRKILKN